MDSGGLFIGTSKLLLALMNSAPAELLHPLTYAALQPTGDTLPTALTTSVRQKKRRQLRQRRNSVSKRTNLFSKKKPPHPIESG
jgi:hypothetical protein